MPKTKRTNPAQMTLAFPPEGSEQVSRCWHRLKMMYPDHLVFMMQRGYFLTAEADARIVSQVTGLDLIDGKCPICFFDEEQENEFFGKLAALDLSVAICEPPSEPAQHLFF